MKKYIINVKAEDKIFTFTDSKNFDRLKDMSRYATRFLCDTLEYNKLGLKTFTIEILKHGRTDRQGFTSDRQDFTSDPLKLIIKFDKIVRHTKNKIYLLLDSAEYEKLKLLFKIEPENEETDPYINPYVWIMSAKK